VLSGLLGSELGVEVVTAAARFPELSTTACDVVLVGDSERPAHAGALPRIVPFGDGADIDDLIDGIFDRRRHEPARSSAPSLTAREKHVLGGVAEGLRTEEIAASMAITRKSVENHKQRIFAKLGVQSQAHAVAVALDAGPLPQVRPGGIGTG
jgi:DNA-binding CsgD family transcriptional regulator